MKIHGMLAPDGRDSAREMSLLFVSYTAFSLARLSP